MDTSVIPVEFYSVPANIRVHESKAVGAAIDVLIKVLEKC